MVTRSTAISWGLAGVTVVVLVLLLLAPPPVDLDAAETEPMQAARQMLEAALQDLESGKTDTEAATVADQRGLLAAASTCGMRRPDAMAPASRSTRTLFALAAFATDPKVKTVLLDDLTQNEDAVIRARAHLGLSQLALRQALTDEASAQAQMVLDLGALPPGCQGDAWLVLGLTAKSLEEQEAALDRAVTLDEGSWSAHLALGTVLTSLLEAPSSPRACARRTRSLIRSLVMLDKLASSDEQLARLERTFVPQGSVGGAAAPGQALVLGMVRERSARPDDALLAYRQGLTASGRSHDCGALLKTALDHRIRALEGGSLRGSQER